MTHDHLQGTLSNVVVTLALLLTVHPSMTFGVDRTITPEELERGLRRIKDESEFGILESHVTNAIMRAKISGGDTDTKQLIIREVLIRNQLKTFGEPCDRNQSMILDPPDPFIFVPTYLEWQESILDSGKSFCDFFQGLDCTSANKCGCLPGRTWRMVVQSQPALHSYNFCVISPGEPCQGGRMRTQTRGSFYYDPLQSSMTKVLKIAPFSPHCEPYGSNSGCSNSRYFTTPICSSEIMDTRLQNVDKYFDVTTSVGLDLGATCNFEEHSRLFTSAPSEEFNDRLNSLEKIQASGGKTFCDIQKFLTCGKSGKCECMPPTVLGDGTQECVLPLGLKTCKDNPGVMKMIQVNQNLVIAAKAKLFKALEKQITDGCTGSFKCHVDSTEMFCSCQMHFTGDQCKDPLTSFLHFVRPSVFANDLTDEREKLKLFTEFNQVAIKFQNKLVLKEGATCDFYKELEVRRLIRIIEPYDKAGTLRTKANYGNLTKNLTDFLKAAGEAQYCLREYDRTPDRPDPRFFTLPPYSPYAQAIECDFKTKKCRQPVYQPMNPSVSGRHMMLLEESFTTLKCGAPCTRSIEPDPDEFSGSLGDEQSIDRLEDLLFNKTQFCQESPSRLLCHNETKTCTCNGPVEFCSDCNDDGSLLAVKENSESSSSVVIGTFAAVFGGINLLWI